MLPTLPLKKLENAHLYMPLQRIFLQHMEEAQAAGDQQKLTRLFSLLPHKQGFTCQFVKISTNGLYSLIKRAGLQVPKLTEYRTVARVCASCLGLVDKHWLLVVSVVR